MTALRNILAAATIFAGSPAFAQSGDTNTETPASSIQAPDVGTITYGVRPAYLVDVMDEGELKTKLQGCLANTPTKSNWSIGHRGAMLAFPEHTAEGYIAAARMGAGIVECDVTFTKDHELVCRHAQNDLHTTTNILTTDLAEKCTTGFTPASGDQDAAAECRTSDLTLAELRTLSPKQDAANGRATTVEDYQDGTPNFRTDLYTPGARLVTFAESIELMQQLGVKMTPELKKPSVDMPFGGFSQEQYAQKMIDELKAAGVDPSDVWPQSFEIEDIRYWIANEPDFGKQAVYLDDQYDNEGFDIANPSTWEHKFEDLKAEGINYIAPPMWMLVEAENGKIVPSEYAKMAKNAGLKIITWTAERSGNLHEGGGWYYETIADVTDDDGDVFKLMDVLYNEVGVAGLFSDWPATTTFFANCMEQASN
ncbi:glycerophosphodiester phosphodiesterase family protein [Notoacmeibacter sp. MSK16QG-6]|uniref:glycerophosphodiester phosphodiesterase family protein n=1 Tax=Notoacmeibacter sp. MSK16QG-6 TaxID=2957982 RepID=UPI0020A00516|nr:glycerophosphodiester phosphodiesterase family protein [Notoacmeibacter sp. MSK16QG-6]MCP1198010.1 glycerophosphodiester phosphodiesterase [Notoacmeibacter sp. MSK16QG-6]